MQPTGPGPTDPDAPRETLRGERLCMRCLQPLVGRPIEREPETGLLYVRCGECGTAGALFDYPTLAPWMRRVRVVVATSLTVLAAAAAVGIAAIAGVFTGAVGPIVADEASEALVRTWERETKQAADPQGFGLVGWSRADLDWLATEEGRRALAASAWSPEALEPQVVIGAFATSILAVAALLLGGLLLRQRAPARMLLAALPVGLGATVAVLIVYNSIGMAFAGAPAPTWDQVCSHELATRVSIVNGAFFVAWTALCALVAPAAVALVARTVLPPADRRLVAWIWEWRGKPVPRR